MRGNTPLLTRLCDISCFYLKPYIFDRSHLSENPKIVYLLEKGLSDIDWRLLSKNPTIYRINYKFLKTRLKDSFGEELINNRFSLCNFRKWAG